MKDMFKQVFKQFGQVADEEHDGFIFQYYKDTYKSGEKARAVNDEVNSYFDRVDANYQEIQMLKAKGISRNKWFEDKLEQYDKENPGLASEITNVVQGSHHIHLKEFGVEERTQPFNTAFEGAGMRIASKLLDKSFTENTYLDILQTDSTYESIETSDETDASTTRYFEEKLDSPFDKSFKKLGTAVVLRIQESGKAGILKDKTPTDIAAIVDRTFTTAKVGYKIANGEMQASDATDYLIDCGVARVEAIIHNTAKKVGGNVGQKVGAALGLYFGPAGTAIGATVGKFLGEQAGEFVAKKVSSGVKKMATYAKEKVGAVANAVGSAVSSGVSTIKSWLGW